MTTQARELITAALSLSLADRAVLAEVLIDSLPADRQPEVEKAWLAEIRERLAAYRRGELAAFDEDEVYAELANDP